MLEGSSHNQCVESAYSQTFQEDTPLRKPFNILRHDSVKECDTNDLGSLY